VQEFKQPVIETKEEEPVVTQPKPAPIQQKPFQPTVTQ
jgi:hypothetical protein